MVQQQFIDHHQSNGRAADAAAGPQEPPLGSSASTLLASWRTRSAGEPVLQGKKSGDVGHQLMASGVITALLVEEEMCCSTQEPIGSPECQS